MHGFVRFFFENWSVLYGKKKENCTVLYGFFVKMYGFMYDFFSKKLWPPCNPYIFLSLSISIQGHPVLIHVFRVILSACSLSSDSSTEVLNPVPRMMKEEGLEQNHYYCRDCLKWCVIKDEEICTFCLTPVYSSQVSIRVITGTWNRIYFKC